MHTCVRLWVWCWSECYLCHGAYWGYRPHAWPAAVLCMLLFPMVEVLGYAATVCCVPDQVRLWVGSSDPRDFPGWGRIAPGELLCIAQVVKWCCPGVLLGKNARTAINESFAIWDVAQFGKPRVRLVQDLTLRRKSL